MHLHTGFVKSVNDGLILKEILKGEDVTKQMLVKATELSFPTVSKTVDELVNNNLLIKLGADSLSRGGRKAEVYRLNEEAVYSLSLYIQRRNIYCIVADAAGHIVMRKGYKAGTDGYICRMEEIIREQLAQYPFIKAITVGVPGGVSDGRVCYIDGYEELENCDLGSIIEESVSIPTLVENNMRAVVYGLNDKQYGESREAVVCLHIEDNGPGCGILVNGRPVSGVKGFAGEVGYLPLYSDRSLQQVAMDEFKGADKADYFARLIASVCVFFNPDEVILYRNDEHIKRIQMIRECCLNYIPEIAMPKLRLSETYYEDYEAGLLYLAKGILFPSYKIMKE